MAKVQLIKPSPSEAFSQCGNYYFRLLYLRSSVYMKAFEVDGQKYNQIGWHEWGGSLRYKLISVRGIPPYFLNEDHMADWGMRRIVLKQLGLT